MPGINPPSEQWFANKLAQMESDLRALKSGRTQFVVDASGTAQTIIGNLANDPQGNSTGLTGWGVAIWNGTRWVTMVTDARTTISTFANGWRQYNGGGNQWTPASFYRDPFGIVYLEGLVDKNGGNWVANETVFTLPVGYRPPIDHIFEQSAAPPGSAPNLPSAQVRVINGTSGGAYTTGAVVVGDHGSGADPVGFLSLAGISFRAA